MKANLRKQIRISNYQQIRKMDEDEKEAKTAYEHEKYLTFELELFERKAKFQEKLEKTKQGKNNQHSKPTHQCLMEKLIHGCHFGGSLNPKLSLQTYRF